MTDGIAWRLKLGVVTPSTNTVVQPEYDWMRPEGVTNHLARMHIPDDPVNTNADFDELLRRIDAALEDAIDSVMTCKPDYLVLGMSSESIWKGGLEAARRIGNRIQQRAGDIGLAQAADAIPAALEAYGVKKRISVITPYYPIADERIRKFADDIGYEIVRMKHLSSKSPLLIAHTTEAELRFALQEVNGDDVEAIVQFGANLPMAKLAGEAERWLGKPVVCVNSATYWYALRQNNVRDKIYGFGKLLSLH